MALNDAVPSSATDVFKRNAEDTDRLLNQTANVVNRVGTTLETFPNATGRVSEAADLAEVQIEAAKNAALLSYAQWNSRGDWATATAYAKGDIWNDTTTSTWYLVLNDYTSGATVNDDINGANVTVLQGAKYSTFEGLSDAVAFVTAHPELFEDYSAIKTSSHLTKAECDLSSIDYPDGSGADYVIVPSATGVNDGRVFIDAGTKQLKIVAEKPVTTIADLRALEPTVDGQQANILGHTVAGIGGGVFYYDASDTTSADNNGTVIVTAGGERWKRNNGGIKNTREFGAIGNYDPLTDTGSDDTLAMQSLFDSLEDGDTIVMEGNVLIDRDSAEIKTVNGVASYICVANSISDLKITGTGKLYQRHHETKDAVGVLLNKCDDLFLDMPIFDGNFKYTDSTPINFKQQLLHIVGCKRSRGGFTVKNSSNVGFLISNEYSTAGATKDLNNSSVFHTVISENCLQNSTYGAGVQKVVINTLILKNPMVGGIKFSSRIADGAGDIFDGLRIDNVLASFDEGYVNPMRFDNSAPNDALAILDNVCQAENCSIGFAYLDFSGVSIPAIGAKHVSRDSTLFGSQPNGLLTIDHLLIKNMVNGSSQCVIVDAQAEGTRIKTLEVENVAGGVQVYQVEANAAIQPKKNKFIDIGEIIAKGNTKALFNADGYDADYIRIGRVKQDFKATPQQAINISGSCNLNVVELVDLDITDSISINGTVNNRIIVKGVVDTSLQDKSPISVNLASKGSDLEYDVNVVGDLGADRKVYINNVNTVSFYRHSIRGCPSGFVLNNIDLVNIADTSPSHEDITALQAWTFNPSVLKIQGTIQNTGSPSGTLVASAGLIYKRTDENQDAAAKLYIKIKDIEVGERNLGWRTFLTN